MASVMVSVEEARRLIHDSIPPPRAERAGLESASGRVLAAPIPAPFPHPRFDNAAMDGFAVRARDLAGASREHPQHLRAVGVVAAGTGPLPVLGPGECAQIMTGGALPGGADAVVEVESTSGFGEEEPVARAPGGTVACYAPAREGQHIRRRGEEIGEGEVLLPRGAWLGPGELGLVASFGLAEVPVFARPRVWVLATGDELRPPGTPLGPGEIYDANRHVLGDLVARAGGELVGAEVVRDDFAEMRARFGVALGAADVVITSGGVSMGRFDHVRAALAEAGVSERFSRVAQKPGGPLFFGATGSVLAFGLPGNPISSFITFMEYVWPVLEGWQGREPRGELRATLAEEFPRDPRMHRFLFGRVRLAPAGLTATPTRKRGSHMLSGSLAANAILGAPPGEGPLPAGAAVAARLLPWATLPAEGS